MLSNSATNPSTKDTETKNNFYVGPSDENFVNHRKNVKIRSLLPLPQIRNKHTKAQKTISFKESGESFLKDKEKKETQQGKMPAPNSPFKNHFATIAKPRNPAAIAAYLNNAMRRSRGCL